MSMEAAVIISREGHPIHWHLPAGRSSVYLPDTRDMWDLIWENREDLLGIAHSHPGTGIPSPSMEDLTTFRDVESALGRRLLWWICSEDELVRLSWTGPEPLQYKRIHLIERPQGELASWPRTWKQGARWMSLRQVAWLKSLREVSY